MNRIAKAALTAATAAAIIAGSASGAGASVSLDATNTGFIGKGDVQTAYAWNNATLQANAPGIDFQRVTTTSFDVACEFYTESTDIWFEGEGRDKIKHVDIVRVTHTATKDLATSASVDLKTVSRKNPNGDVNGFKVNGTDSTVESGDPVPAVGDACLGNGQGTIDPHIVSVTPVAEGNSDVLNVLLNGGNARQIFDFNAPVAVL